MAGLFDKLRARKPKIEVQENGKAAASPAIPDNLWVKCAQCGTALFRKTFEENLKVCDKCGHPHKLTARERVALLLDEGTFQPMDEHLLSGDPLGFGEEYLQKLAGDRKKTGLSDAVLSGTGKAGGIPVVIGVMDFHFRGGSMGSVVGEQITRVLEKAAADKIPAVVVTSSGGARMQEGMLSLMQMAKTAAAVSRLNDAKVPYITVLTDPTTAGVAASFASLGDIILAEPRAIIGFSGARVIEQTIRQKLPPGFQTAEFYLQHGFIDQVVPRTELRDTLIRLLSFTR